MDIYKTKHKKLSKVLCFLFIFIMCFQCFIPSQTVYAKIGGHDTYVIQPRLDSSGIYKTGAPVRSQVTFGKGLEESNTYNFGKVFESNYSNIDITTGVSEDFGDYLYFSFPSHDAEGFWDNAYSNSSGDMERAAKVATLIDELNRMIEVIDGVDGTKNVASAKAAIEATKALVSDGSNTVINPNNNYSNSVITISLGDVGTIFYCYYNGTNGIHYVEDATSNDIKLRAYYTTKSNALFDETEASKGSKSSYESFYWAQLKGYLKPDGSLADSNDKTKPYLNGLSKTDISPMGSSLSNDSGDNAWISIFDMATVANYYYAGEGLSNNDEASEASWIEEMIFNIVSSFALGLKSLLGLSDVTELIYSNDGSLSGGTMSNSWWSIMLKYHLIFQVVAWMLVGLAVAKLLLELNFSTINPNVRVSIFETLQKVFIVGFLLALAVPIMRLMTDVNGAVVNIFASEAPTSDGDMFTIGGTLANVIAYFSYIGILLMINCTYIMRGIMIAIFGASAPLFIVSMLFSKGKGMFDNWLKEMAANIFLQSIHAFAFAFLFSVIKTSAFLPKLVVFWSLMPITEQFRGFIFGSSGGFTTKQGMQMGSFIQKQATAQARSSASTGSNMAGKVMQNSNFGKKLGLKGAEETGNASGVGGGQGQGRGQGAGGGNGLSSVAGDAAKQMRANGAGKSATAMALAGHALSGGGQMGGQAMDMMDAMTDIQMGDFNSASRSLDNVRSAMGNMATSVADYGSEGFNNWRNSQAKKTLEKASKNADSSATQYANAYAGNNFSSKNLTHQIKGFTGDKKNDNKIMSDGRKIAKAMKRIGVSNIESENKMTYGSPNSFQGRDGNEHSVVDSSALSNGSINAEAVFGAGATDIKKMLNSEEGKNYELKDKNGQVTGYSIAGVSFDKNLNVTNARALSTGVSSNGKQTYFNTTRLTQNVMSSHENQQQRIKANQGSGEPTIINNTVTFSTPTAAKAFAHEQAKYNKKK